MRLPILTLAAVSTATALSIVERDPQSPPSAPSSPSLGLYPIIQILPIPGYNNASDGFNSLGSTYTNSAAQLSYQADSVASTTEGLRGSGTIQYSYDIKANLTSVLSVINNLVWQTAYEAEKKVCAIATSINEQNVGSVKGNLRAGIYAEAQAIIKISTTLANTIAAIKAETTVFVDAEKAVVTTLIQAIAAAAVASLEPVARLSAGLSAAGIAGVGDVVQTLSTAVVSLQALAQIKWEVS